MKNFKLFAIFVLLYSLFVVAIPRLLIYSVPCLDQFSNARVEYHDCNLIRISNYYLITGILGLIITMIVFAFIIKLQFKKQLLMVGIACSIIFVYSYYQFLPIAEKRTLQSNVFLDTFYEEYAQ